MNEMDEILKDFIVEADELLAGLDEDLIELEKTPENSELLNRVFRSFHTLKGAAGFLGLKQIVDVAHRAEDCLNKLRQGLLKLTPFIMDAILKALDMLKLLLFHVKEKDGKEEDLTEVLTLLTMAEDATQPPQIPSISEGVSLAGREEPRHPASIPSGESLPPLGELLVEKGLITQDQLLDALKEHGDKEKVGDVLIRKGYIEKGVLDSVLSEQKALREVKGGETIRVDIKRLDDVMNMVGELVLGRNRLIKLGAQLEARYSTDSLIASLKQLSYELNLITADLQLAVMKVRMQPVSRVFSRFPRMVRDLARQKGKEVELVIKGEETELDKTVIEEIGDPLVHLVRNAVDHGIESPEERIKKGKPSKATLTLTAEHKGSNIFISIEDDGRGIDVEKIKRKAVERGIATVEEIGRLGEKEVIDFIFHPGFSTADTVTDTSGRGVGMDVVKTNITRLNGSIDIETKAGQGTTITLRLPLTLAIIQALMVRVGKEDYAIPLSTVLEIINVGREDIKTVEGREVIYSRDTVYPLLRFSEVFKVGHHLPSTTNHHNYAVIIAIGERKTALLVEELCGREEVVVKSLGEYFSDINMKGFSGATITGDGRVVLILDVAVLFDYRYKLKGGV